MCAAGALRMKQPEAHILTAYISPLYAGYYSAIMALILTLGQIQLPEVEKMRRRDAAAWQRAGLHPAACDRSTSHLWASDSRGDGRAFHMKHVTVGSCHFHNVPILGEPDLTRQEVRCPSCGQFMDASVLACFCSQNAVKHWLQHQWLIS